MSDQKVEYVIVSEVPVEQAEEDPQESSEGENDDTEISIPCRLCSKEFANPVALRNHVNMLHIDKPVDISDWIIDFLNNKQPKKPAKHKRKNPRPAVDKEAIQKKTEELVSKMEPLNVMSLVSEEVSYIIVKADNDLIGENSKNMKRKGGSVNSSSPIKKEKEVKPITGPFECLQPSLMSADKICHQIFFSCCEYSLHYRDEHTRRRKAIRCQVCEKVLSSGIGEDPTSPYTCLVCGTGFPSHSELASHTAMAHAKLKPFSCCVCNKRFTQVAGLNQHMRLHTGDRPYPCPTCDKAFTQKAGLDQHMRIHTKVKPYKCVICAKAFCQSVHLKQHMRTHTNVAPFQCVICEKKFKQSSHLNYHLKHHNYDHMTSEEKEKYQSMFSGLNPIENVVVEEGVVEQDNREYILSDNGDSTWSVKVVQDE